MECGNLYKDPLTGMNNLFGLLEYDLEGTKLPSGVILVVDLMNLSSVNRDYGKAAGDAYIQSLARLIDSTCLQEYSQYGDILSFRIGGDEFLIIIPGKGEAFAQHMAAQLHQQLNQKMAAAGIYHTGIHFATIQYFEQLPSASLLLKQSNIALSRSRFPADTPAEIPEWVDHMIDGLICRVRETLTLLQQANTLAFNDEISQLPNYRAADFHLKSLYHDYLQKGHPFSFLLIDGDNLKKYNDLSYKQGNQMIRDLGNLIRSAVRYDDQVFRWLSGDEFAVIPRNCPRETALQLAERIRSYIEIHTRRWPFPITVSIGVASCPQDGNTIEAIVEYAEKANSLAKHSGKNMVV